MRNSLLSCTFLALLTGCQSTPAPLPGATAPVPAPSVRTEPPSPEVHPGNQRTLQRQQQMIAALIEQNDVLIARAQALEAAQAVAARRPEPEPVHPEAAPQVDEVAALRTELAEVQARLAAAPVPAAATPAPVPPVSSDANVMAVPNADGVIDLTAPATSPGEPVNPFVVRTVPAGAMREVTLQVGGIVAGEKPCALINDRILQPGDTVDSLAVVRVEADSVVLRQRERLLRVPLGDRPTKIRLAL